jgi:DNA repair protein RecO (recombination protein O)
MPLYTADAIILRTYKLGETDRIVVFLTRDRGKKRGVARRAGRSRRRFGGALEPLTCGRVAYVEREQRELVALRYVEPERSPLAAADPAALPYAAYFAELLDAWAQEADPNERLYRLGAATVEALALGADAASLARYVEYWVLRLQGLYPSLRACPRCGGAFRAAFLVRAERTLVCARCGGAADRREPDLSGDALAFLERAGRLAPDACRPTSADALRELEAVHRALMTDHLERELRSVRVLRDMSL